MEISFSFKLFHLAYTKDTCVLRSDIRLLVQFPQARKVNGWFWQIVLTSIQS